MEDEFLLAEMRKARLPMKNLQIGLEARYATKENLERIAQVAPGAKAAVFSVEPLYPLMGKIRGALRRLLPFYLYDPLSKPIDSPAEAQKLLWRRPPVSSLDTENILLFPPGLGRSAAEALLRECPPRWVHSIMTGVDRIPPLPKEALLTSSRGVHSRRIAEFTMGLIFALAKNIPEHTLQTRRRSWKTLPSRMVEGSCLGIVGLGSIGSETARLAKKVGMEVWAVKRRMTEADFVDRVLPPEGLHRLLQKADYVVLSVPLTRETRMLIGKEELDVMKPSAVLINVSRGAVVDETALYRALKHSQIRRACIDVFEDERPLPRNSRFYRLPNLLVTSFSAFSTAVSGDEVMDLFFENLGRFNRGEALLSTIGQQEG